MISVKKGTHQNVLTAACTNIGESQQVLDVLEWFEKELEEGKVDPEEIPACFDRIKLIRELAAARIEGTRAAHDAIIEALDQVNFFSSYDREGGRLKESVTPSQAARF